MRIKIDAVNTFGKPIISRHISKSPDKFADKKLKSPFYLMYHLLAGLSCNATVGSTQVEVRLRLPSKIYCS